MQIIVRQRDGNSGYQSISGRGTKPVEGHRKHQFTGKQEEAKVWNTLYAATDYICKSDTEPVGIKVVQPDLNPAKLAAMAKKATTTKGQACGNDGVKPTTTKKGDEVVVWKGEKKAR